MIEEILSENRKTNLGLTLANQFMEQVPDTTRAAILGNAALIAAFRLGYNDAEILAPIYRVKIDAMTDQWNFYAWLKRDLRNSITNEQIDLGVPPTTGCFAANLAASRAMFPV